jgi:hypothetical protein
LDAFRLDEWMLAQALRSMVTEAGHTLNATTAAILTWTSAISEISGELIGPGGSVGGRGVYAGSRSWVKLVEMEGPSLDRLSHESQGLARAAAVQLSGGGEAAVRNPRMKLHAGLCKERRDGSVVLSVISEGGLSLRCRIIGA